MTTLTEPAQHTPAPHAPGHQRRGSGLKVSTYDQVSSLLVALLVILGFIVALMFMIWYSTLIWTPRPSIPVTVLNEDVGGGGKGRGEGERYVEEEFEEPAANEMQDTSAPKVEETLDAISLAVAAQPEILPELTLGEKSSSWGNGKGKGQGDGEGDGFGPGTKKGVPAWERWEVRLNATSTAEYAKQLDFFKIELGIAGGGSPDVIYVTNVGAANPTVRTGKPKDEKRLRFMHRSGALRDADKRLAAKAKVDTSNKIVCQFYPQQTYDALLTLENIAMRPRSISQVRRTVFGVKQVGSGYEFFVISQDYK